MCEITDENIPQLSEINISMNDILFALKNFEEHKSSGNSIIPNFVFKKCQNSICKFLFILFNEILKNSCIPIKMKKNIITPICKKAKPKTHFDSYRPVSVSLNIYKIFESVIFNSHINPFISNHNLMPKYQYGFRKNYSRISISRHFIYYLESIK